LGGFEGVFKPFDGFERGWARVREGSPFRKKMDGIRTSRKQGQKASPFPSGEFTD